MISTNCNIYKRCQETLRTVLRHGIQTSMIKTIIFILLSIPSLVCARLPLSPLYYGKAATEGILEYTAQADIPYKGELTVNLINNNPNTLASVLERLDYQVQHLMGVFQSESFTEEIGGSGVLSSNYDIKILKVDSIAPARKLITYKYTGKVVFDKSVFNKEGIATIPIKLPLQYDQIYSISLGERTINPCSDRHYNSEDDFWYFWDPDKEGCPLQNDTENVIRIKGRVKKLANTRATYPEYNKLYSNDKILKTSILLGYIDTLADYRIANHKDPAYKVLRDLKAAMIERDFVLVDSKEDFKISESGRNFSGANYAYTFEKEIKTTLGTNVTLQTEILLSDTEISTPDPTFHAYLVDALENSDIVIYDGHSGLGANLDPALLPTIKFKKNKYQIYFFNGCSSYPYYVDNFVERKGGTKNLDVITAGLPTYPDTSIYNLTAFLDPIYEGKALSYQTLMNALEDSNGDWGTYLTGVSGDEDNLFKP
jgi:hypothetical protein